MINFKINFTTPWLAWLLLLLIPAVVLTLLPYFRLQKKYRRTRNRIISVVLHMCIMVMCIAVLSGMTFAYDVSNDNNEMILLVDSSFSNEEMRASKNTFVEQVIRESRGLYKIGVVKFGYDQQYVAPMSNDVDEVLARYNIPARVDTSATDIASALNYTASLFTNYENAKIVLICDGLETDGDAQRAVRTLVAETGIKVDTMCFPNSTHPEYQIVGIQVPDYNISVGEKFSLTVTVQSSSKVDAVISITDLNYRNQNNEYVPFNYSVLLAEGVQNITIPGFSLNGPGLDGLHELRLGISQDGVDPGSNPDDKVTQNNNSYSYIKINTFNKILMVEGIADAGKILEGYLKEAATYGGSVNYEVDRVCVKEHPELIPYDVDELRTKYDQVILANTSNKDLEITRKDATGADITFNFASVLETFTSTYGGGVFAYGGHNPDVTNPSDENYAHAFNHSEFEDYKNQARETGDLSKLALANLLPVEVVDYTPPMAVVIIIDRSGSMASEISKGVTKLDLAKSGALSCLDELSYRDYIGIMTLEDGYSVNVGLMSVLNKKQVVATVDAIAPGGGTSFGPAIDVAGQTLIGFDQVEVKHMILITDGGAADSLNGNDGYGQYIKRNFSKGITFTIIQIGSEQSNDMKRAGNEYGHGDANYQKGYIQLEKGKETELGQKMREAIGDAKVTDVKYEEYTPTIKDRSSSIVRNVTESSIPKLGGFYGTREKDNTNTVLSAKYVPLYTEWQHGAGKVGAFMCSLDGTDGWSDKFMASNASASRQILYNIIAGLMPTKDISPQKINAVIEEKNYSNTVSVTLTGEEEADRTLAEDEIMRVEVQAVSANVETFDVPVEVTANASRAEFQITQPGVYKLTVMKLHEAADGDPVYDTSGAKHYTIDGKHYHEYLDNEGVRVKEKNYVMYKTLGYSDEYNMFSEVDGAEFMRQLAQSGHGMEIKEVNDVFLGTETVIHKSYDPRWLFMILSIIFFLLDIAVRKFKFKWPHEIVRDYKQKKEMMRR